MGELNSQPQPVLSCYGSHDHYLGTDYGSMSTSAFGETCKLIGSNPAIPTLLPSEIGSSYDVSPSRYSNCLSEGTKFRSKTVSNTEIANSRNNFRSIER